MEESSSEHSEHSEHNESSSEHSEHSEHNEMWDSHDAEDFFEDDDRYEDTEGMDMLLKYVRTLGIEEDNIDDIHRELRIRKGNQQFQKGLRKRRAVELFGEQDYKMRMHDEKRHRQLAEYDARILSLLPQIRAELYRDLTENYQQGNINVNEYRERSLDLEAKAKRSAAAIVNNEDATRNVNIRCMRETRQQLYRDPELHFKKLPIDIITRIMNIARYAELYENITDGIVNTDGVYSLYLGIDTPTPTNIENIKTFALYLGLDPYGKSKIQLRSEFLKLIK